MTEAQRANEYLICKQRGQEEDYDAPSVQKMVGNEVVYAHYCTYCGTLYWTEEVQHEDNVPKPKAKKEGK